MPTDAIPTNRLMVTRAVRVDTETYELIWRNREPSETFAAALRRLLLRELGEPPDAA